MKNERNTSPPEEALGWFAGRLPDGWFAGPPEVQTDREEILESPYVLIGTLDEMVEALHARRERWGLSYFVTFDPLLEALAPIVARLAGK